MTPSRPGALFDLRECTTSSTSFSSDALLEIEFFVCWHCFPWLVCIPASFTSEAGSTSSSPAPSRSHSRIGNSTSSILVWNGAGSIESLRFPKLSVPSTALFFAADLASGEVGNSNRVVASPSSLDCALWSCSPLFLNRGGATWQMQHL